MRHVPGGHILGSECQVAALPADAGDHRLGPHWGDDKERLRSLGLYVLVRRHHVGPFHVILWVQSVKVV